MTRQKETVGRDAANSSYESRRARAKMRYRCGMGAKQLIRKPWKNIPVLVLVILFVIAWKMRGVIISHFTAIPFMVPLATVAVSAFIPLFFLLLVGVLLSTLGRPRRGKEIEDDVASAFKIKDEDNYKAPFLISKEPVKGSDATVYVFHSRWLDLDHWNKNREAILWALNAHSDEAFTNGKKKYTVVLRASSGAERKEREVMVDPLFKADR